MFLILISLSATEIENDFKRTIFKCCLWKGGFAIFRESNTYNRICLCSLHFRTIKIGFFVAVLCLFIKLKQKNKIKYTTYKK